MTLNELNESTKFTNDEGVIVYLDRKEKQITLSPNEDSQKRGMVKTIKDLDDLDKVLRRYRNTDNHIIALISAYLNADFNEYKKAQNAAKKENTDSDFRRALAAMQKDVLKMSKDN